MQKQSVLIPVTIAVLATLLVGAAVQLMMMRNDGEGIEISTPEPLPPISYSIYGAVNEPGMYSSQQELRIATAAVLAGGLREDADLQGANLSGWIRDGDTIVIPTIGAAQSTLTPMPNEALIDLNTATAEELMELPGIGEKKATDIIALREAKHGFRSADELLEINGISENILSRFYDRLVVSEPDEKE